MVLKLVCCVGWRCKESAAPLSGPIQGSLSRGQLGGSWVVISRVKSRITIVITHIKGLLTLQKSTHEPPRIPCIMATVPYEEGFFAGIPKRTPRDRLKTIPKVPCMWSARPVYKSHLI